MTVGRILALDYGDRRIGVAVSDPLRIAAHGLGYIENRGIEHVLARLKAVIAEKDAVEVVVGLPLNMDGTKGPRARVALAFARVVAKATGLKVYAQDERLTSYEAERSLEEMGLSRQKRKERVDAVAAQMILRSFLDDRGAEAVGGGGAEE